MMRFIAFSLLISGANAAKACTDKEMADLTTKYADKQASCLKNEACVKKGVQCAADQLKTPDCAVYTKCIASAYGCFPADAEVITLNGPVQMKDLRDGDAVKTLSGFEKVLGFTHANSDIAVRMVKINHAAGSVSMTPSHMITLADGSVVPASEVSAGSQISVGDGSSTVTKVEEIVGQGIFSPKTASGTIVVNGVVASVYSQKATPVSTHYTHGLWYLVNYGALFTATPPAPLDVAAFVTSA